MNTKQTVATSKIAALTIANAMVFQEVLSSQNPKVPSLRKSLRPGGDPVQSLLKTWDFIVAEIDYVPIFKVAAELLEGVPADKDVYDALRALGDKALEIVAARAALRHDLMGRVYHQLLVEAKFLGTFYTSVPSATLLLMLALNAGDWSVAWADVEKVSEFRIADLACGTGTLLMAAAEAVTDNHVRSAAAEGVQPDLPELHCRLMERVLYGFDVLPSALHLTASTLALRASAVKFKDTKLFSLPLGGASLKLGSIEFLRGTTSGGEMSLPITQDLFGGATAAEPVVGYGEATQFTAPLPRLDLCVMNPPFTRSVGGNLLFGSRPEAERDKMQKALRILVKHLKLKENLPSNTTAGLGSIFVAIGHKALRDGGRLALVLPRALLSGVAWEDTRQLIQANYELQYIIVSHDPLRWNFSDNTAMSETMIIARRIPSDAPRGKGKVVCINLWRNPTTAFEAFSVARTLIGADPPDVTKGEQGAHDVRVGKAKVGEAIAVPWKAIRNKAWMQPCAFAQADLVRASFQLIRGQLVLPGVQKPQGDFKLATLGSLGSLGPDRRDIHDGFSLAKSRTAYPSVWGHDALAMTHLEQEANKYLSPLSKAKPGRPLRKVNDLWPKAGRVLLAERLWLHTQSVIASRVKKRVLSNVWWPFNLPEGDEEAEKALVLWLNGTLGLIIALAHREETRGAWVAFKKPVLHSLPVLSVELLTKKQKSSLASSFDELSLEELQPWPQMASDPIRARIDVAIQKALGLKDFAVLRELLAQEPIISLKPLT